MSATETVNEPAIILGAARSGTKLLRSLIAAAGCHAEVPYDVNYIWRYGNESHAHDALTPDALTTRNRHFIRRQLPRCARNGQRNNTPFVEKTVSNILRIPFVSAVYPEAKYVLLVRDGRDVAESAARCWREPPQTGYLIAKARAFPWRHCAPYAWKYAAKLVRRRLTRSSHLRSWGPRYPGIDVDVQRLSLIEVCARQWAASMEYYENARHLLRRERLIELRYESLVCDPTTQIGRLARFLGIGNTGPMLDFARATIHPSRIASRQNLTADDLHRVTSIAKPVLERWGYETHTNQLAKTAA